MAQSQISLHWLVGGINGPADAVEPRYATPHKRPHRLHVLAQILDAGVCPRLAQSQERCTIQPHYGEEASHRSMAPHDGLQHLTAPVCRRRHAAVAPAIRDSDEAGGQVLHIRLATGAHHLLQFLSQEFQHIMDAYRPVDPQAPVEGPSHAPGPRTSLPHRLPESRAPSTCP